MIRCCFLRRYCRVFPFAISLGCVCAVSCIFFLAFTAPKSCCSLFLIFILGPCTVRAGCSVGCLLAEAQKRLSGIVFQKRLWVYLFVSRNGRGSLLSCRLTVFRSITTKHGLCVAGLPRTMVASFLSTCLSLFPLSFVSRLCQR